MLHHHQALDEDQPGDKVEHRKVFEEDRDFNQGAPAVKLNFCSNCYIKHTCRGNQQ